MKVYNQLLVLIKCFFMIIGASVVGLFLLWLVYLLPTGSISKNIIESQDIIYAQDDSNRFVTTQWSDVLDTYTNIIMYHEALYPGSGNAFQDALLVPSIDFYSVDGSFFIDELIDCAKGKLETEYYYPRYWHGNLVVIKPLLMFLNLEQIYIINAIILLIFFIVTLFLLYKNLGNLWIAYAISILLMKPWNIVQSFQLSVVFYVLQIIMLMLLSQKKSIKERALYIFVLDGILVAYFDFLTYPYVALGIPLLTAYLLMRDNPFKENCIQLIKNGAGFVIGYAGMWGMKWVYASLFTSENVILDAINTILFRLGATEDSVENSMFEISKTRAVLLNLETFLNKENVIILFITVLILLSLAIIKKYRGVIDKQMLVFCSFIAITPFIWVALLENHCCIHPHLEWRTYSVFVYAIMILILSSCKKRRNIEEDI